jgi:hypothetical protein
MRPFFWRGPANSYDWVEDSDLNSPVTVVVELDKERVEVGVFKEIRADD